MQDLKTAGIIAIPLMPQPETGLKPMPNYFVIENQFGNIKDNSVNIQTGNFEETECVTISYKIVKREILANDEVIERVLLPFENINISVDLLPKIFSYQRISENIGLLNSVLSNFQFQGDLQGFNLIIDESKLVETSI